MTDLHPYVSGFLSEVARDIRNEVHRRYQAHVQLMYDVNRHAVQRQHELQIHLDKLEEGYGAALYARTLASTQSAAILLEHGLPSQARTVLRSALETLFPLAAIARDASIAASLVASHDADRRTVVDRIRRWKGAELRASIDSKISASELDEMTKGKGKALNQFELAKLADMEDWYLTIYTLLSFAAHASVADLDSHVEVDQEGNPTGFKNEPELSNQESVWAWIVEVQLAAMRSLGALFRAEVSELEPLSRRLQELSAAGVLASSGSLPAA